MAARALTDQETSQVRAAFTGKHAARNLALFEVLFCAGFRVSEVLSLWTSDVYQHGKVVDRVSVTKQNMKGKKRSRSIPLHPRARKALEAYLAAQGTVPTGRLFDFTRMTAWRVINDAFEVARIPHPFGTHAGRKTFAKNLYEKSGHDFLLVSKALGHENTATTQRYLFVDDERMRKLICEEE